jgi:hypothetical protein
MDSAAAVRAAAAAADPLALAGMPDQAATAAGLAGPLARAARWDQLPRRILARVVAEVAEVATEVSRQASAKRVARAALAVSGHSI